MATDFGDSSDEVRAILIQSDGHIVVVGQAIVKFATTADIAIARYNKDGSLDQSFGAGGKVTTDIHAIDDGRSVAIHRDGKIVVAGSASDKFAVARYNTNGLQDLTFGTNGVARVDFSTPAIPRTGDELRAMAIQRDGKIVAVGFSTASIHSTKIS